MPIQPHALILGATGGIGGQLTAALLTRGWTVTALTRDPARAAGATNSWDRDRAIRWVAGDAMNAADVLAAADGAQLIVHAVNPPGYRDWDRLVLPMVDNTIAAARATGARILLPGTVYNYGPEAYPVLKETSPQAPVTRKGAIRAEMERRLQASGLPVLIVRAGDFFGGLGGGNNWFSQGMVKPGQPLKAVANPGRRGVSHAWAYLPDLAETMAELVERTPAEGFQTYHFQGHLDPDGQTMAAAVARAAPEPVKVQAFPWALIWLASPFVTLFREMREMAYLWKTPQRLDNARLLSVLGREPHTPLDIAVSRTLADLGCI